MLPVPFLKRDIHDQPVLFHLAHIAPKTFINSKIQRELAKTGKKVWKSNVVRFQFGVLGYKVEHDPSGGKMLSHKSENHPWGGGVGMGVSLRKSVLGAI
ncbi:hypothetical protein AVEN_238851-1 [Araneus ventricosus]|uniref:Uncharacterized protein n=1 Tax=Araneus ventricosus TaxID=182803 RepID=A0A4Y2EN70_ARAVE|nr:hypothetical protein AVEN_238851-1 [Araneus ventricosus]